MKERNDNTTSNAADLSDKGNESQKEPIYKVLGESGLVEDDQLYFNLFRQAFTFKGNTRGSEEIDHFEPEFVLDRFWEESQEDTFIDDLGFFISLIKGELE